MNAHIQNSMMAGRRPNVDKLVNDWVLPTILLSVLTLTIDNNANAASFQSQQQTYKLSNSNEFKLLPKEPILSQPQKELHDLMKLQDERLDLCADKGKFWEHCFIFGERENDAVNQRELGGYVSRKAAVPTW